MILEPRPDALSGHSGFDVVGSPPKESINHSCKVAGAVWTEKYNMTRVQVHLQQSSRFDDSRVKRRRVQ